MSSSEDLATPCLQPCTPALPDGSSHNTASCHPLPTQGRPLPPPGHGLIVSQKCLQPLLSMSSWALLPGVGAGPHRARMGSDVLPHGPFVICELCQWEPVGPVVLLMAHEDLEIGLYLLVHALHLAISLQVAGG